MRVPRDGLVYVRPLQLLAFSSYSLLRRRTVLMRGGIWLVRYTYSYIARAMRALQSSSKTSLRIDDEGLLSMQFMMPGPRRQGRERSQAFIEFWVSARL